jgi:cysteine desulfurase
LEVDGVASEAIVVGLDRRGTAVHSGSACSSETFEPSPVLAAMGVDSEHSVRLSVSRDTGDDDVRAFGLAFRETVADLRRLAST